MTIEAALRELESLLPGVNYVVGLRLDRVPPIPDATPAQYITAALGPKAVVGGVSEDSAPEVLAEVERCLRYPGDRSAGPPASVLGLRRFTELVEFVLEYLARGIAESEAVFSFWLKDGHPFYPVFWDFAYLLVGVGGAEVLIGSSSD